MISNAEYFSQLRDLEDQYAAEEITRAELIAAQVALADQWAVPATLAAQVVDFTAEQRTVLDQIGLLNLTGTVASVGELPGGAANGDTYVVTGNGHVYLRVTDVWKDLGVYGGRGGSALYSVDGEPDADLGIAGDMAIDLETGDFYGPKTSDGWGDPVVATGLQAKVEAAIDARDAAAASAIDAATSAEGVSSAVAQIPRVTPTILAWREMTIDASGRMVLGERWDNTFWAARDGALVQVDRPPQIVAGVPTVDALKVAQNLEAPGLAAIKPTIATWQEIEVDGTGRFIWGRKFDNTEWVARAGAIIAVPPLPPQAGIDVAFNNVTVGGQLVAPGVAAIYPTVAVWKEIEVDQTGRIVGGTRFDNTQWVAQSGVLVEAASASSGQGASARSYAYDYLTGTAFSLDPNTDYAIITNGQSLALGAKNNSAGDATVTTSAQHPGYALMFNVGVRPDGVGVSSYIDLREQNKGGSFETHASGMADVIMTRLNSRLGWKPRIIFASAVLGSQAYFDPRDPAYGLKRGSETYTEALRLVQRMKEISAAQGRKLIVLAQMIVHGERDALNALQKRLYGRALDQWNMHFDEDCRLITGQSAPVRTYLPQANRGGSAIGQPAQVALAQLSVEDRNPRIRCVGPIYQSPGGVPEDGNDGTHVMAAGYRMMGGLEGHFIVEDLFGPYEQPLRVIDAYWVSSTVVRLQYSKPIAIETTNALINVTGITVGATTYPGLGADGGVKFTDGSVTPPTVTGISIASGTTDTLEVTLSGAPAGKNPRLTIASYRPGDDGAGAERGPRSAIRSSASFHTDSLLAVNLYHWACHEQVVLPPI